MSKFQPPDPMGHPWAKVLRKNPEATKISSRDELTLSGAYVSLTTSFPSLWTERLVIRSEAQAATSLTKIAIMNDPDNHHKLALKRGY